MACRWTNVQTRRCARARARAGRPVQTIHPGAPSHRRTRGDGHTHAAWAGEAFPAATIAVPLTPPPPSMARRRTQSPAGNGPPVKAHKQAITATHRDPPRTLAAVRSPGAARNAGRASAPSTRTAKEARHWAIGGRHGQIRARMCGLPHLPHDAHIPDLRFTLGLSVVPARPSHTPC